MTDKDGVSVEKKDVGLASVVLREAKVKGDDLGLHADTARALLTLAGEADAEGRRQFKDGKLKMEKAGWRYLERLMTTQDGLGWPGGLVDDVIRLQRIVKEALGWYATQEAAK